MSKKICFESERLQIRRFKNDDFNELYAYRNDELAAKYQSWTEKSKDEIDALINEKPTLGKAGEWFTFAIAIKKTDILIGECAFCINDPFTKQAEMGITLNREAQGKGYATEAIHAILNFLFENTLIERIIFITYLENQSCINLISKLSASHRLERSKVNDDEAFNHYGLKENETLFTITKEEWQKALADHQH